MQQILEYMQGVASSPRHMEGTKQALFFLVSFLTICQDSEGTISVKEDGCSDKERT